ncbi:MAG TPA: M48 family metalloprotease [Gaiellaceae bacterium]
MSRRRLAVGLAAVAAGAGWAVAAWLLWRTRVPGDLRLPHLRASDYFPPSQLRRAARYQRFLRIDWVLSQLALVGVLGLYAVRGAGFARQSAAGRIGTGMLLGMLGFALVWLAQLPFGLASLWWQRRYGISHAGYFQWIVEGWFGLGGLFLFLCLALLIVMGLARPLPRAWPVVGAPVFVGLALLVGFLQPYLLPSTHEVHRGPLVADVRELAPKEGIEPPPVAIENVHGDTSAPNAEATGFGPSRRVIVWDTLLDGRFSEREIRFVLAHELGHLARNHLWKGLAWYALFAVPGAALIAAATRRRGGMAEPAAVPVALLALVVLGLAAQPLQAEITRHIEFEADWMALQTTRDPGAGRSLFRRFGITALDQPDPPSWDYLLLEDHPTLMQRIAMTEAWKARYATSSAQSP